MRSRRSAGIAIAMISRGSIPKASDCARPRSIAADAIRAHARCCSRPGNARTSPCLPRTAVAGIRIEAGRATGVDLWSADGQRVLHASREVLLCAGAIHSPQLLMLSGIGPAEHLESLGIIVKSSLPGVGANYHDHPAVPIALEMRDTTSYGLSWRTLPRAVWNVAEYALARRGPLASNVFESTAFIRSFADADRPDIQIAFQPARRNPSSFPLPLGHGFAMSVVNLYPRSRGEVRLASTDPRVAPRVNPNILADPQDLAPLLRGLRLARQLCDAPAFAPYQATEVRPGRGAQSDAQLLTYLRQATATAHHPVGSCRMGVDAMAVVDPNPARPRRRGPEGSGRLGISEYCRRQHQRTGGDGGREGR